LNTQSSFQTLKFFHSRENIFDCSPIEIMNRTVNRTVQYIKDKYSTSKKLVLKTVQKDVEGEIEGDVKEEQEVREQEDQFVKVEIKKEEQELKDQSQEVKQVEEYKEEKYLGDVMNKLKTGTKQIEDFYNEKRKKITPLLFELDIENIELFLIGEGSFPSACGVELKKLNINHKKENEKEFKIEWKAVEIRFSSLIYQDSLLKRNLLSDNISISVLS
jgi:hypothetical protein